MQLLIEADWFTAVELAEDGRSHKRRCRSDLGVFLTPDSLPVGLAANSRSCVPTIDATALTSRLSM